MLGGTWGSTLLQQSPATAGDTLRSGDHTIAFACCTPSGSQCNGSKHLSDDVHLVGIQSVDSYLQTKKDLFMASNMVWLCSGFL